MTADDPRGHFATFGLTDGKARRVDVAVAVDDQDLVFAVSVGIHHANQQQSSRPKRRRARSSAGRLRSRHRQSALWQSHRSSSGWALRQLDEGAVLLDILRGQRRFDATDTRFSHARIIAVGTDVASRSVYAPSVVCAESWELGRSRYSGTAGGRAFRPGRCEAAHCAEESDRSALHRLLTRAALPRRTESRCSDGLGSRLAAWRQVRQRFTAPASVSGDETCRCVRRQTEDANAAKP